MTWYKRLRRRRKNGLRPQRRSRRRANDAPLTRARQTNARAWRSRARRLLRLEQGNRHVTVNRSTSPGRWLKRLGRALGRGACYLAVAATLFALPVGVRATYGYLLRAPHFMLRQVEVIGAERLSSAEIIAAAGLDRPVNTLSLDARRVSAAASSLDWVRSVDTEIILPGSVRLRVKERHPRALVAMGSIYMVDENGALFRHLAPGESSELKLLTGFRRADLTDPARQADTRRRLRDALLVLQAWEDSGLETITPLAELNCHPVYGHILRVGDGQSELWLGQGDYRAKLDRFADIDADLRLRGEVARQIYLDTEDATRQVVVSAQPASRARGADSLAYGVESREPSTMAQAKDPGNSLISSDHGRHHEGPTGGPREKYSGAARQ